MNRHDNSPSSLQETYNFRARALRSAAFMLLIGDLVRVGRTIVKKTHRVAKTPFWTRGRAIWTASARWLTERAARRALQKLDDRMLKDIGVSRGEIESVVRRPTQAPARPPIQSEVRSDLRSHRPEPPTASLMRTPSVCG